MGYDCRFLQNSATVWIEMPDFPYLRWQFLFLSFFWRCNNGEQSIRLVDIVHCSNVIWLKNKRASLNFHLWNIKHE
jgi:hypothetical protein